MEEKVLKDLEKIYKKSGKDLVNTINKFKEVRASLMSPDTSLNFGDFVIDNKNQELGIVIGTFYRNGVPASKRLGLSNKNDVPKLLITEDPEDNSYRVRYTKPEFLTPCGFEDVRDTTTAIKNHCENECIVKCNSSCSLFKFKD